MSESAQQVPEWRKSSYSGGNGGECVELTASLDHVLMRDSKNPDGPVLSFQRASVHGLFARIRKDTRSR